MAEHEYAVVADDDPLVRRSVVRYLTKLEFTVLEAPNGAVARNLYFAHPQARLVVSDMDMGREAENGPALFKAIRSEVVNRKGVFIAMSSDFESVGMRPVIETEAMLPHSPLRIAEKPAFVASMLDHIADWKNKLRTP